MTKDALTRAEQRALDRLATVPAVQAFLDCTPYSVEKIYRCPRRVLLDRFAHCFDGAVLAAAALERLGHPPLILDMRSARDDPRAVCVPRAGRVGRGGQEQLRGAAGVRAGLPHAA